MFENCTILITGACGTVGKKLVDVLLNDSNYTPRRIIGVDNNESDVFFQDQRYISNPYVTFYVADIRDSRSINNLFKGVDIVFHCAALKHVTVCEKSPNQAVLTNILGLENIISAAENNDVKKVIFTSSDKAVNPTNVMGTTKLMGERLITAANNTKNSKCIFASTRFGNVLGSNGSVVPIFKEQILSGGPVTITDKRMTRFVMSVDQAVKLVLETAVIARGGEVFVTKMPVVKIVDLAAAMIEEIAPAHNIDPQSIKLETIGSKPGEKLYEELVSRDEMGRSVELDKYYCILPAHKNIYNQIDYSYLDEFEMVNEASDYISSEECAMSIPDIKVMLHKYGLV